MEAMQTRFIPAPRSWQALQYHELADCVDFGRGIDLDGLVAHMKANGYDQDEAIVLYRSKILDGRHRHEAAKLAGVVPTFKEFVGKDPVAYVTKKAFRQHLDETARCLIAAMMVGKAVGSNQHV